MFSELFILQIVLSFIVGGVAVATAIAIAEKFGSRIGALVLNIPIIGLVGLLFIGIVNSAEAVQKAIPSGILGMILYLLYLSIFLLGFQKLGRKALVMSIVVWLIFAFFITKFLHLDIFVSTGIYLGSYIITNLYFNRKKIENIKETPKTTNKIFFSRAIFAGLIISFAVFLSKALGPEWGGVFAMFPAATTSSLWVLAEGHKKEFVESVATKMLFFSFNVLVYIFAVYVFYDMLGIWIGTLVSFMVTVVFAYLLNKFSESEAVTCE